MVDNSLCYISNLICDIYVFILVGGKGFRLYELIIWCVKLVFYFGGKFRIIDFLFFNCINLGI